MSQWPKVPTELSISCNASIHPEGCAAHPGCCWSRLAVIALRKERLRAQAEGASQQIVKVDHGTYVHAAGFRGRVHSQQ